MTNLKQNKTERIAPEELAGTGMINIWLDSYNGIFSDFDSHPYSDRTISDDFIAQAKKIHREKAGNIRSLKLLLPAADRNQQDEKMIAERLQLFFIHAHKQLYDEVKKTNILGLYFIVTGIILMITASYISFLKSEEYYIHLLLTLFEPAGWFMLWSGFDHLIYFSKGKKGDLDFYSKMAKAEVAFKSV